MNKQNITQYTGGNSKDEKSFDCVKFKRQLQENVWKVSKAKNSKEIVDFVNKVGTKSSLYRPNKTMA